MKNILLGSILIVLISGLLFLDPAQNAFSVLFSPTITGSSDIIDSISKALSVLAKGSNVPGNNKDTRAPSTVMNDGIPIGVVVPSNFDGVVVYTQNETATSSKFILVSQVINIIPINGTAGDAPNGNECESQCDVIFVIHESNVIKAGLSVEELCNLKVLHDVNDDGDFDDADEVLDTIVTDGGGFPGGSNEKGGNGTSNGLVTCSTDPKTPGGGTGGGGGGGKPKPGFRVSSNDVPEFSKFAIGGVVNLFVGGGSSGSSARTAPTFGDSTFSILQGGDDGFGGTFSANIIGDESQMQKVKVGEKVILRFDYTETKGINNIGHVTLYINGNGIEELQKSQSYVRWQKWESLQIRDEDDIFRDVKFDILTIDSTHFVLKFELTLDNKLKGHDMLLKTWNLDRAPGDLFLKDSLIVSEYVEVPAEKEPQDTMESLSEEPLESSFSMDVLNGWAGYSENRVSDSEFLEELGLEGNNISNWFKKSNMAKWIRDDIITQQEFFNALSFIVS